MSRNNVTYFDKIQKSINCKIALIIKYFKLMTYLGTTLLQRFVRAPHTITTSSSISTWDTGITVCKILKFFHRPMTRSTWILTRDSCLDVSTSSADSCFLPLVKWGIRRMAPQAASSSRIKNHLSAKTSSIGSNSSRKPDSLVICLSETRPPHPGDNNKIAPAGVMAIKYFKILLCL